MAHLNTNFDETPDTIPPIPDGQYLLAIGSVKVERSKKGDSDNVIVEMSIVSDDKLLNGRRITHYINQGKNPQAKLRSDVKLKQLCTSAGLVVGASGIDTEELIGLRVKAHIKPRIYKDDSGNDVQGEELAEYLKP